MEAVASLGNNLRSPCTESTDRRHPVKAPRSYPPYSFPSSVSRASASAFNCASLLFDERRRVPSALWATTPKAAAAALSRKRRRDTPDRQHSKARHDSAVIAQFPVITPPVVSFSSTTVRSCGLLSLKSSILLSVPAILSNEPLPIRWPPRNASSINRMIDV